MTQPIKKPEKYLPRWITPHLQNAAEKNPVVVLTGARQVGKSTLLAMASPFKDWRYHTLDDLNTLNLAIESPEELWFGTDRVVIDEVQKAPNVLSAIKIAVDRSSRAIHFALSGSANLALMKSVSESLAGRAIYFNLHPLALGEISLLPPPNLIDQLLSADWPSEHRISEKVPDHLKLLLRGFLPPPVFHSDPTDWNQYWDSYVTTYLERDLRQLSQIEYLPEFQRLMELAALRTGQLLNISEIGRDAKLSQSSADRYLNLLETTLLFERLSAFTLNRTSRLIKSPKVFWNDPALPVFLAGYFDRSSLEAARELGAFFENLVFHHLRVLASLMIPPARLFYWRTRTDKEVDFILEHGRKILAIEVKLSANAGFGDIKNLKFFLEEYPEAVGGLLLYNGSEIRRLGEKILAVPWTMVAG
jgi:hypothetical protein